MQRLWPDPDPADLDEPGLAALYAPTDRSTPHLRVNFVTSLDGAVAVDGYSAGLSSAPDKTVFGLLRTYCDALMVGAGTLRHEGYGAIRLDEARQAKRLAAGLTPQPGLVVVSARLDLDPGHQMFTQAPVRPVVLTHGSSPRDRQKALAEVADLLVCGEDRIDLRAGVSALNARGLTQILSEGGPHLFGGLMAADLVDELCLTLAPLLAGPGAGRIVAGAPLPDPQRLRLAHVLHADGNLIMRYLRPPA